MPDHQDNLSVMLRYKKGWPWDPGSIPLSNLRDHGQKLPRITVVTPSFNHSSFIEETIRSVLLQGYPNLEYMIIDGGSKDESAKIIGRYEGALAYWVSEIDQGQSDAINKGWQRSTGEILTWLNSDDFYYPGTLAHIAQEFNNSPDTLVLCSSIVIVDEKGNKLATKEPYPLDSAHLFPWGLVPGQPGVFIRRSVFEELGGPRLDLHFVLDWEYWLRISLHYPSRCFSYSNRVVAASREWGGTKTNTTADRSGAEVRRVQSLLLQSKELPDEIMALRKHAYARTWWRQSVSEYRAGKRWQALRSLTRALIASPKSYPLPSAIHQAIKYFVT